MDMTATSWAPADTFGNRLALLRHELHLTLEEAADRCGLKRATWRTWELGISHPRNMAEVVDQIAAGLARDGQEVNRAWLAWGDKARSDYTCNRYDSFPTGLAAA